jgi:hypothetical protein
VQLGQQGQELEQLETALSRYMGCGGFAWDGDSKFWELLHDWVLEQQGQKLEQLKAAMERYVGWSCYRQLEGSRSLSEGRWVGW